MSCLNLWLGHFLLFLETSVIVSLNVFVFTFPSRILVIIPSNIFLHFLDAQFTFSLLFHFVYFYGPILMFANICLGSDKSADESFKRHSSSL